MFNDFVTIYGVENLEEKTDVEALRELAKKTYANCRKNTTEETYKLDEATSDVFYNNNTFNLGYLERILVDSSELLLRKVTYRPHRELLKSILIDLNTGEEDFFKPLLIEDVINDVAYQYFKEDEEVLALHKEDPVFHVEYIISKFKPMVNSICKVLKENEFKERIYK